MIAASPPARCAGRVCAYAGSVVARRAFVWIVAGLVGLAGCRSKVEQASGTATSQRAVARTPVAVTKTAPEKDQLGWVAIRLVNPPPKSIMDVPPEKLPAYIQDLYRLRPDRRFLYAAAEMARLTGTAPGKTTLDIQFEGDRWRLSLDGSPLGDLPEYPDFDDAKELLLAHVPPLRTPTEGIHLSDAERSALEDGDPASLLPVLSRLNAAWKDSPGDPAVAEASLRGLLWLALQTYDELELSDPILGKALALFALVEARTPGQLAREECLLASLLGYEDHATAVARTLPEDDPVRAYADWDLAGLKAIVRKPSRTARSEYLFLLLLAKNRPAEEEWLLELTKSSWGARVDSPSLRLLLTLSPFGWRTVPSALMESKVFDEVVGVPGPTPTPIPGTSPWEMLTAMQMRRIQGEESPLGQLSKFEAAADREAARLDGPLLDRHVVRGFRFANFYSAVYEAARYDFDSLGSTEAAESLGNAIVDPPPGTAAELKDWILHRVRLRQSPQGVREVALDLGRLKAIGTTPLSRISYSVAISTNGIEPYMRQSVPEFFAHMDSRPANLHAAFRTASELLSDPAIVERCMRLATKRSPRELDSDLPWALSFMGNADALRGLANDRTWSVATRSAALTKLAEMKSDKSDASDKSADLIAPMRALIREDPSESRPLRTTVGILEKEDQTAAALTLIDAWLAAHPEHDLAWAGVASTKSRLLRKQGKYKEAWKVAEPAAATWKAECLNEAALALLDLGRTDDALAMANRSLKRYGGDDEAVLVARILWTAGKDGEAAAAVTPPTRQLDSGTWAHALPSAFLDAFKKASDEKAAAAFNDLAVPSVPKLNIVWFIEKVTREGRPQLALKLCDHLRGKGGPPGYAAVAAYHALVKAGNTTEAREWLRANATPADMDVLAKQALLEKDYELAWDLPDHPDPEKNDILHLIRAVCLLYQPDAPADRRTSLIRYFEGRPKKDFVIYGQYFLGQADQPTLFAQIKDPSYVASIGWILGVMSMQAGRYDEANAWLQVCMETGAVIPPRYWSSTILGRWKGAGCGLEELARQRVS